MWTALLIPKTAHTVYINTLFCITYRVLEQMLEMTTFNSDTLGTW
jgi:hypothetical protein